jgi:hypothetical protein
LDNRLPRATSRGHDRGPAYAKSDTRLTRLLTRLLTHNVSHGLVRPKNKGDKAKPSCWLETSRCRHTEGFRVWQVTALSRPLIRARTVRRPHVVIPHLEAVSTQTNRLAHRIKMTRMQRHFSHRVRTLSVAGQEGAAYELACLQPAHPLALSSEGPHHDIKCLYILAKAQWPRIVSIFKSPCCHGCCPVQGPYYTGPP